MTTTHRIIKALLLLGTFTCLIWLMWSGMASASPGALPSPSPTVTPTPEYASAELVAKATRARKAAVRARQRLSRVRRCFRDKLPVRVYPRPGRGALKPAWEKALRRWRYQRDDWRVKYVTGRAKMRDPGGSGWERWRPLVRWIWPAKCVDTVVRIMRYESGGNPRILCGGYVLPKGAGDGQATQAAGGLMQNKPAPRHWADPEFNLRYAYERKYLPDRERGGSGWGPWRGCKAFL